MHIQNKTLFHASEVINQPEQFQAGLNKLTNIKKNAGQQIDHFVIDHSLQ